MKKTDFQFYGVWLPPALCDHIREKRVSGPGILLYAVIRALRSNGGCYASNGYLAHVCGITTRNVQVHLTSLIETGMVLREWDGPKRLLLLPDSGETTSETPPQNQVERPSDGGDENHHGVTDCIVKGVTEIVTHKNPKIKKTKHCGESPQGVSGFFEEPPTGEDPGPDAKVVHILMRAVQKLPPRKTGFANAKPSIWKKAIRDLRCIDNVPEDEILRIAKWYEKHIGEAFVPEAYSGKSFREKFPALCRQANKETPASTSITDKAMGIVARLVADGYGGDVSALGRVVQQSLDCYDLFLKRLEVFSSACSDSSDAKLKRHKLLAAHLQASFPGSKQYIHGWVSQCGDRVFAVDSHRFRDYARKTTESFTGDGHRWDVFKKEMDTYFENN